MSTFLARTMSESRTTLSQQELHFVLCRAFDRIRPTECKSCKIPKPAWRPCDEPDTPNWALPIDDSCRFNCGSILRWLSRQYGTRYDLERPL